MSKLENKTSKAKTPANISDQQRKILQNASRRSDLLVAIRKGQEEGVRSPIKALIRRGLLEETPAAEGMPAWTEKQGANPVSLAITPAGLQAIGREPKNSKADPVETDQLDSGGSHDAPPCTSERPHDADGEQVARIDAPGDDPSATGSQHGDTDRRSRRPSKRALVIDLLRRVEGTPLGEIVLATDWLPHTTRAALTGLRRSGFILEKLKGADGQTRYRIVGEASAAPKLAADEQQPGA